MNTLAEMQQNQEVLRNLLGLKFFSLEEFKPEELTVEIHDGGAFRIYAHPMQEGFSIRNDGFQDLFELWATSPTGDSELIADFRLHPNQSPQDWQVGKDMVSFYCRMLLAGWLNYYTMTKCYLRK